MYRTALACGLIVIAALASCTPVSVTFTFGADRGQLDEAVVIDDGGDAKVALIDVRGLLLDLPQRGIFSHEASQLDELTARLARAEADTDVKAVVLRINSPGGSVTASDTLYHEVQRFRERTRKPVVASLGEIAASGGYYIALAADRIIAQPTGITGSIGVIFPTLNVSDGLSRIGITARSVKSGANKDIANPLEPMREPQYALLQQMVDEFHARFRGLVVDRRPHITGRIDELADGRILTGSGAVRAGLADAEGDLRDSFAAAKRLAGLDAARLVKFYPQGGDRPRTPYAAADIPGARHPAPGDLNLLKLDLGGTFGAGSVPPGAYYLWLPGSN